MASTTKGKTPATAHDWRLRVCYEAGEDLPSKEALAAFRLPVELRPETTAHIPKEFSNGANYLTAMTGPPIVPWDGYYVNYNGTNFAVANAFGVWFEIRKRENTWEAFRRARAAFALKD